MKKSPLEGKRVELVFCGDPWTRMKPGTQGTVMFVDDIGTIHVKWDTGENLGLTEQDAWRLL